MTVATAASTAGSAHSDGLSAARVGPRRFTGRSNRTCTVSRTVQWGADVELTLVDGDPAWIASAGSDATVHPAGRRAR